MSSEERQRIIRRAGAEPAEAEKQEGARESRKKKRLEDADLESEQARSDQGDTPLTEVPGHPPRPRR
jgi:hypothetical protein